MKTDLNKRRIDRFLFVWIIALQSVLLSGCTPSADTAVVGSPLGNFRLDTLKQDRFYLNQHRGKVVVLFFWATWCKSCMQELGALKHQPITANPGVTVASICIDPEDREALDAIVAPLKPNYPVLQDYQARMFNQYRLRAVPTTLVIDTKGVLQTIRLGGGELALRQIVNMTESLLIQEAT